MIHFFGEHLKTNVRNCCVKRTFTDVSRSLLNVLKGSSETSWLELFTFGFHLGFFVFIFVRPSFLVPSFICSFGCLAVSETVCLLRLIIYIFF